MEADGSEKIEKFGRGGIVRETEVYVIVGLQLSPLTGWVMRDDSVEILFQSFLQEAFVSNSGMGRDVHSLILSSPPAFPLPTTASPTSQGALKDGFGEAVVACDMPEPCKFPSLGGCQKMFLWTHMEVDLAPHSVTGLVLQVGDVENFSQALSF